MTVSSCLLEIVVIATGPRRPVASPVINPASTGCLLPVELKTTESVDDGRAAVANALSDIRHRHEFQAHPWHGTVAHGSQTV
ncbi:MULTISPECIES: hypothetical protein [Actinoalloteichus]|uniref:hypothetical protein n=1 Tax=Actinoalloteichus TaxID=65496 RepID=UPI0012F799DE|nr:MULTISPECIES: hypothetical protein [Actinoalloteichus]